MNSRPTRVRFLIVATAALAAVVLYLDRVCLSFVEKPVSLDLNLNSGPVVLFGMEFSKFSLSLSAFFFTYALFQVPAGYLGDRFGARRMLTIYLFACVLCTLGIALAQTFLILLITRLALGIAEAGAYPTCAGILRRWVPLKSRGFASSMVTLGGRLGGASTPFVTALLLVAFLPPETPSTLSEADLYNPKLLVSNWEKPDANNVVLLRVIERAPHATFEEFNAIILDPQFLEGLKLVESQFPSIARKILAKPIGERTKQESERLNRLVLESAMPNTFRELYGSEWRTVFFVYAGVGLVIVLIFWLIVRDRPSAHPWCNEAEIAMLPQYVPAQTEHNPNVVKLLLGSRNLWLSSIAQFCNNIGWAFLITRLPLYLSEVFNPPIEERGLQSSVPLYAGVVGMLIGGLLTDRLARRFGVRLARALPMGLLPFLGAAAFFTVPFLTSAWSVVFTLAFVAVATDMMNPSVWSFMQDITRKHVGVAMGFANMWGNFGAALSPLLLPVVKEMYGWNGMFTFCGFVFIIGGSCASFINASKPLDNSALTK